MTYLTKRHLPICMLALVSSSLLFSSCQEQLSPLEYKQFIEQESNLFITTSIGENLKAKINMEPSEYKLSRRLLRSGEAPTRSEYDAQKNELDKHLSITLGISCENGESVTRYLGEALGVTPEEVKHYFTYQGTKDFFITQAEGDTLNTALYEFEYSHNAGPFERFNLVFEKPESKHWPLTFYLPHPITGEYITFLFEPQDYFNLPALKNS